MFDSSVPGNRPPHVYPFSLLAPGYLRDVTGNYTASFMVAGAFLLMGSGVLITLPHFCFSVATSKPQDLVTDALDTKAPLPKEGQSDPGSQSVAVPGALTHFGAHGTTEPYTS